MQALTNRTHPLPSPFIEEILLGRDSLSLHEAVASNLGSYISEKNRTLNEIARYLRSDSVSTTASSDSLILLLTSDNTLYSYYSLVSYYLYLNDFENAELTMQQIPIKYELSAFEQKEYNGMSQIVDIQTDLFNQNLTYSDISEEQKGVLYTLSNDTLLRSGVIARNIISLVDTVEFSYGVVIPIIDTTENKSVEQTLLPKLEFEVSPNPANEYFLVDYQLPIAFSDLQSENNSYSAKFVMFNYNGEIVYSQPITKHWYQLLVETDNIQPGFYVCKLYMDNTELAKRGIIIKPDLMSAEQNENAGKQQTKFNELQLDNNKLLRLYPNPASTYVFVEISKLQVASIEIVDAQGKVLITEKIDEHTNILKINTSMLVNGIYYVNLINDNKIQATEKLIIE
jgi:hypothetical protein